jgi:hypothetical protein
MSLLRSAVLRKHILLNTLLSKKLGEEQIQETFVTIQFRIFLSSCHVHRNVTNKHFKQNGRYVCRLQATVTISRPKAVFSIYGSRMILTVNSYFLKQN